MMRSLILIFFLLSSAIAAGASTFLLKQKGDGAIADAWFEDGCKVSDFFIQGNVQTQREKNGKVITSFTNSIYAYYSEYNRCTDSCTDSSYVSGWVEINPAEFSSSFKTGASAEINMDVESFTCVDNGTDRYCDSTKLFELKAIVIWTPNGTPSNSRSSSSYRDKYSSYRFTYSGTSVPATIELSLLRDGVPLDMNDWFSYGTLYNSKSGETSKTKYAY